MATLLELLSNLSEEQRREGESVTVIDSAGREATITFGPTFRPPQMVLPDWYVPLPDHTRWHTPASG